MILVPLVTAVLVSAIAAARQRQRARRRTRTAMPVPRLRSVLPPCSAADGSHDAAAARQPSAGGTDAGLRRGRLPARRRCAMHLRQRKQVAALPRRTRALTNAAAGAKPTSDEQIGHHGDNGQARRDGIERVPTYAGGSPGSAVASARCTPPSDCRLPRSVHASGACTRARASHVDQVSGVYDERRRRQRDPPCQPMGYTSRHRQESCRPGRPCRVRRHGRPMAHPLRMTRRDAGRDAMDADPPTG